jgi:hypothetical protein
MKEDLLPMKNWNRDAAVALLMEMGLSDVDAAFVAEEQLFLTGTYTLHSQTAKKNGGDFDFDQVCVVDEGLYPKFVQDRFDFQSTYVVTKTKAERLKSPMYSSLLQKGKFPIQNLDPLRASLTLFAEQVYARISDENAEVPDTVAEYVPAVQKGSSDKSRRAARHRALLETVQGFF